MQGWLDLHTMSLTAGAWLGPYEILALLGTGGPSFAHKASYGGSTEAKERTWR
jgi:hypothetical protein